MSNEAERLVSDRKHTQELRTKLWCGVYAASCNHGKALEQSRVNADIAVSHFDASIGGDLNSTATDALPPKAEQVKSECTRLSLDLSAEHARALHRIVRSMHDGHCPKCSYLGTSDSFYPPVRSGGMHQCPRCQFTVTDYEAESALEAFRPYLQASVELFENWRASL
jgi:hypothetical protein